MSRLNQTEKQKQSDETAGKRPEVRTESAKVGSSHLSQELQRLIQAFAERSVRLRDVLEVMDGRGYTMLLILLAFPFCTPVPLPGVSTPFGLVIALIGLRLALVRRPWLPEWLLNRELPPKFFSRLLGATRRMVDWMKRFVRPRGQSVLQWWLVRHLIGMMILTCGILLMLPFPVPLSNGMPALTVLLLAAAVLEEDGYVAVIGGVMFLLTLAFFGAIFWGGVEVIDWVRNWLGGFLIPDDAPSAP